MMYYREHYRLTHPSAESPKVWPKRLLKPVVSSLLSSVLGLSLVAGNLFSIAHAGEVSKNTGTKAAVEAVTSNVQYKTVTVEGVNIFYREAGSVNKPTVLLLHGFPTSSHMFRNIIPTLAKEYHVIAPDYPGYGNSATPTVTEFDYSFDHLASLMSSFLDTLNVKKFSMYVMDYGAPIGYRLMTKRPGQLQALIVQNGNAYNEGLENPFWDPLRKLWKDPSADNEKPLRAFLTQDGTRWQYVNGTQNPNLISPDNWVIDQAGMDRPGNKDIQIQLFKSYGTNPGHYPEWQAYFRQYQPPTLVEWGKNDVIFPAAGAYPYKRDLKNVEFHLLNTGHFALEEYGPQIASDMLRFLKKNVTETAKK